MWDSYAAPQVKVRFSRITVIISLDDIYQKIGRNIVILQKIEKNLKLILASSQLSGPASKLADIRKNNVLSIKKKTLGGLIQQFTSNFTSDPENSELLNVEDDISEPHLAFKIHLSTDSEEFEYRKNQLNNILKERNDLVHHLLLDFDLSVDSERIELANKLDLQYEQAGIVQHRLDFDLELLRQAQIHMAEFLSTPLFTNSIVNPDLINCLIQAIEKYSRSDGWTDLAYAGQIISREIPKKYKEYLEFNKVKKLSDLINTTGLFEITRKKNENDVMRVYFKPIDENLTKIWCGTASLPHK